MSPNPYTELRRAHGRYAAAGKHPLTERSKSSDSGDLVHQTAFLRSSHNTTTSISSFVSFPILVSFLSYFSFRQFTQFDNWQISPFPFLLHVRTHSTVSCSSHLSSSLISSGIRIGKEEEGTLQQLHLLDSANFQLQLISLFIYCSNSLLAT